MAKYRFFKKNKYSRKVEIRRERVEFEPGALLICLAAAVLVWLYVAGTHWHNTEQPPAVTEPAETEEVTVDESATDTGEATPSAHGNALEDDADGDAATGSEIVG